MGRKWLVGGRYLPCLLKAFSTFVILAEFQYSSFLFAPFAQCTIRYKGACYRIAQFSNVAKQQETAAPLLTPQLPGEHW